MRSDERPPIYVHMSFENWLIRNQILIQYYSITWGMVVKEHNKKPEKDDLQ